MINDHCHDPVCSKFILFSNDAVAGVFNSLERAQENAAGRKNSFIEEWIGLRHISTYVLAGWIRTFHN